MAKRVTDTDARRIAEAINNLDYKDEIIDDASFDWAYDDYFDGNDYFQNTPAIRRKVFSAFKDSYPKKTGHLFAEAGGKSLSQDRRTTAQVVVTDPEEYKRRGARRTDLKGYDTKRKPVRENYPHIGKAKGKIVYAKGVHIQYKTGRQTKYRDRRGRFVSVKK